MTQTMDPSVDLHRTSDSDAEVGRESLTESIFRRIDESDDDREIENLRGQVVEINMRVAESLARRYYGHGENPDDLKQVAYLGLVKATRGFHAELGHNFLSYAVPTITGELKKHFRDRCWTVRPPRRVQDLQRDITAARQALVQDIHRHPTVTELAEELDVPVAQVTEASAAQGCFSPMSLDARVRSDSSTRLADLIPSDDRDSSRSEAHLVLAPVIQALADHDREILALRFFNEWTQEQIAEQLGTSQMQVSRYLARLMRQLRAALEPADRCA